MNVQSAVMMHIDDAQLLQKKLGIMLSSILRCLLQCWACAYVAKAGLAGRRES